MDVNAAVQERYSAAAQEREEALCCPIADYDPAFLDPIPPAVLERDYGCGDPSRWVRPGDTVLDLGSGGGKICFIAAQMAGPTGTIIGVDRNREMLDLARASQGQVAGAIGYDTCQFKVGNIQDLALDLEKVESWLDKRPVRTREDLLALTEEQSRLRRDEPLIADDSVDLVVSNCVLNLVGERDRRQLFQELYRVVKHGGRVAISDIVCDEDVPDDQKQDAELWSGCLSGAFREDRFLQAFADVGFHGIHLAKRDPQPWRVVGDIEYRAVTVVAYKGKEGPCLDAKQAVIYPGPWREVHDDDGHIFRRGERIAVCQKTFNLLTSEPYSDYIIPVPPYQAVDTSSAPELCSGVTLRHPQETKNGTMPVGYGDDDTSACCQPGSGCC